MTATVPEPGRPRMARWLSTTNSVTATFLAAGRVQGLINLAGGLPAPELYPADAMAEIAGQVVRDHPAETLGYGPADGLPALKDALAGRLATADLHLSRDNVLITGGALQALDLVGKVLVEPGQTIAVQAPTYLGALDAWRPRDPVYRPITLDAPGLDAEAALAGAQFGYAVPNFSNPTGHLVGLPQRQALVAAAHRTGTWLVEDDPYGTLYYDAAPLPRLIELSAAMKPGPYAGPVIYIGTLSKEIAPGLRIGWVIAAPEMIAALTMGKLAGDMCSPGVTQRMAAAAIRCGLIDRIQPQVIALYRARRDALCAAMAAHLSGWLDWEVPVGGMFVWATLRDPSLDSARLAALALEAGVCVAPGASFDPLGRASRSIRLNFTLNDADRLQEGVRRLARALAAA
jgi:2-aminoadipate transaminase